MRLGVVSQWYDPEGGSAAVTGTICRSLSARGHEVHVLTGFPNYPAGRIYPGYRIRPYQYEYRSGIHVHRVPLVPSHDRSAGRRAVSYLSFAACAAIRLGLLSAVDAWLVYSTPATAALPAMAARSIFGRPYVLYIQDLWPDTVVASGFLRPGRGLRLTTRCLHSFCDASYRWAAAIAVTSPGMVDRLAARGVPASAVTVVPNWVDEAVFRPTSPDPAAAARLGLAGFVVMYAGCVGDLQGLDTAIEAAAMVPEIRLAFVGTGVAETRLRVRARNLPNVTFLGQRPVTELPGLLANSQVQLISLKDLPVLRGALPSKLQASLASGRPVIGAVAGDAGHLIERAGAGLVVPPGDAPALADAIRRMYALGPAAREAMGRAGRQYYVDNLSERVGSAALARLLHRAIGAPAPDAERVAA